MWKTSFLRNFSKCAVHSKSLLFENLPGPKSLPVIGSLHNYLPLIGSYSLKRIHWAGKKKLETFGPLVREQIQPGVFAVFIFKPEDYKAMYLSEDQQFPERRSHLAVEKYRQDRPEIYSCPGLLPTNGQEWWRIRQAAQKALSKPKNIRRYLPVTDETVREFLSQIPHKTDDFLPLLSHLNLELTCLVTFDERISSFNFNEHERHSRSEKLINAAFEINSCISGTDHGPQLWRYFETPIYRKIKRSLQCLESVAIELVSKKQKLISEKKSSTETTSVLEEWLTSGELSIKDITGLSADMLLAGIDTTTYTSSMFLYHLATNESAQESLAQEAKTLLPTLQSSLNSETLDQARYAKAALKESLRLNPISVGVGRILSKDTVLSGCNIPKGTVVITQNQVSCRLPEYFEEPNQFLPERWIKTHAMYKSPNPFLSLPFGHGRRSCIARRFAEQNILVLILQLIRRFKISWTGNGNLDVHSYLINKPDKPLSLLFTPREN